MDKSSRVFYGFILLAIIGLVIKQNNHTHQDPTGVMIALVVLGIVFAVVAFNMFERYALRDNLRTQGYAFARYRKAAGNCIEKLEAELNAEKHEHAKTNAQKKRFTTMWRRAKGYDA